MSVRKNTSRRRGLPQGAGRRPQNATALNYLGYMLADRGVKLDEALGLIRKRWISTPPTAPFLDSLGWAYFRLGKYESAEDTLIKASQRIGTDPTVQDHLGDLYQKTGRLKLAAAHWERAIAEWNKTVAAEVDQKRRRARAEKVGIRQDEAGQRRLRQQIASTQYRPRGGRPESRKDVPPARPSAARPSFVDLVDSGTKINMLEQK